MADELDKNVENREITDELQESYLDYAMSVIVSRALPDVRDGLKPVQRRILWSMWSSGVTSDSKFRKSADVVGNCMGQYHPHGDQSIYQAIVRMVQDFTLRYPLCIGQGNWGSIDGDEAAAHRYTETKLSKMADALLDDIEKDTVDWQNNYSNTKKEPKYLPAKVPHLLLNGTAGIAVGMATNIPPHNLGEVVDATIHLSKNPKASTEELLDFVKGPDFPTGGIIFDKRDIKEAYTTGKGGILMRAVAEIKEKTSKGKQKYTIQITEIPYQVNKSELIIKMAELVQTKKIDGIKDIRDESDKHGMSIVIELKPDANPQKILNQLYTFTDLQKKFNLNMVALTDNGLQPQILSLRDILEAFLEHRKLVVRRRAEYELRKAQERAHILEGLSKALDHIDQVISTIKKSADRDEAKKNLIKKFKLSEAQAHAILEMRLSALAALERQKIEDELKERRQLIKALQELLKSPAKIITMIQDELVEMKKKYGDERRTKLVSGGIKKFEQEDLIKKEETIITLSQGGYIKQVNPSSFKAQHRGGKGLIGSSVDDEDFLRQIIYTNTHDNILFFTDRGRVFQTKVYEIPTFSRTAKGKPVHNFLEIPIEEKVHAVVTYPNEAKEAGGFLVMATTGGMIKKTSLRDFENIRRSGIIGISLKKDDILKWVELSTGKDQIILTTTLGQAIRFKEANVRSMGRTAAGVRGIKLRKDDTVSSMSVISEAQNDARLLVVMSNGYGKQTPLKEYKVQSRGGSGIKTAKVTKKTGEVMDAWVVKEEKEMVALSAKGQVIRTEIGSVRKASRATQGVRIMNLKSGDHLIGIICF
ncbi:MAG: DNA gyrase subunit A [Candidatus Harrisonbacteria bacterium]|nr:DNA gyrase subunit A [Candidatus Harrisonbacteria bacterium]